MVCVCLSRGRELTERRLHVSELPADGGEVTLDEAASRHVRVWRLRTGDPIVLFDGRWNESAGHVLSLDERVICIVERPTRTIQTILSASTSVMLLVRAATMTKTILAAFTSTRSRLCT